MGGDAKNKKSLNDLVTSNILRFKRLRFSHRFIEHREKKSES